MSLLLPSASDRLAPTRIVGVPDPCVALALEEWIHRRGSAINIVIGSDQREAEHWIDDLRLFRDARGGDAPRLECLLFPELPAAESGAEDPTSGFEFASDRLTVLERIGKLNRATAERGCLVVVSTPAALLQHVPSSEQLAAATVNLTTDQDFPLRRLVDALQRLDYDCEALCEAPGQYAVRGGIVDVYPITADQPYRVDYFGDRIESIRAFDPVTQRSLEATNAITLASLPSYGSMQAATSFLTDHLSDAVHWLVVEPEQVAAAVSESPADLARRWADLIRPRPELSMHWTEIADIDLGGDHAPDPLAFDAESLLAYRALPDESRLADERLMEEQAQRSRFFAHLLQWHRAGERILVVIPRPGEESRIQELLRDEGNLGEIEPRFLIGTLNEGFRIVFRQDHERLSWPSLGDATGLVVVSETEIFGCRRRRRARGRQRAQVNQSQVDQMLDFSELVPGEFVVHLQHGIAIFRGVSQLELAGERREVLTLEFDAGMQLHVPLQESHLVSRYVGLTKVHPQLGRIGSGRWEKVRAAAERATLDYAAQLLATQAQRLHEPGFAFAPDGDWQSEFEATFPYRETVDQLRAIQDVKADMENEAVMDRLICGDVGYGKTEVAIRAAFKAVMSGRQVAMLVPTTVLAQQHFRTFRERMSGFPIVVEMVSRFRNRRQQNHILAALVEGRIDILIGTHRLIQSDVSFRNLGLVVIDEEQRFGVKHKEVFKRWRSNVDVISMSATPIPRTLYLALTGARNLSVIETPPAERRPIQTIVRAYDEKLVIDVIRRELRRGGQVFYLHNRVMTIDLVASRLRELLPDVSFGVGHGQMNEKDLEEVMLRFVDGKFQVLVCTTIIESGLDIPNCNTIIIEGADRFGLSQLYQLRGRVGRFRHQAYAYLLLHRHARLLDVARKRLHAIRQHNQLGAGFRIAMRDLELRGAGNLLGAEQSGHIVGVGFELYCQLLRQSIARLKGESTAAAIRASVALDFVPLGERRETEVASAAGSGYAALKADELAGGDCPPLEARIPGGYIDELRLRVDFYRRLAMAENLEAVRTIARDLEDRFGPLPDAVKALVAVTEIRCLAEQTGIISVTSEGNRLKLRRASRQHDDFVMPANRFPRLTARTPLLRLREIIVFLNNLNT